MWLVLGGTAFLASLRATQSRRALLVGRWSVGILFIVFGALTNAVYLVFTPEYYEPFATQSPFTFVEDTWASLVVPHLGLFITALVVAELVTGVLVLYGDRATRLGLALLIGFHVGQLAFGGVLWVWAPLMILTLSLLLRAERRQHTLHQQTPDAPQASRGGPRLRASG